MLVILQNTGSSCFISVHIARPGLYSVPSSLVQLVEKTAYYKPYNIQNAYGPNEDTYVVPFHCFV